MPTTPPRPPKKRKRKRFSRMLDEALKDNTTEPEETVVLPDAVQFPKMEHI
jgi:hypothetical protein